jgi:membrane fusion protein, multidrug efflux system
VKTSLRYVITGIVLLALVGIVAFKIIANNPAKETRRQNVPLVKIEKPRRETFINKLQLNGDVAAIQQANIFSKVSGNLERVYTDMGARVRRNQLLAVIDSTELYQQYQLTAATFENTRVKYQRFKQLLEQNLVSKEDVDDAEATMKVAAANYDVAKTRLSYTRITAPFSGYITKRYLDAGALVSPGNSTLFTLMDLDSVKVIVNVLEKDLPRLPQVKKATVTVDALPGKEFNGIVARSSEAIDLSTRTLAVEVDVPNTTRELKPGMFAEVTLIVSERQDALTLPTAAVLKDDSGSYVFASEDNKARQIRVTAGGEQDSRTEIISGLEGNEDIITTGQQFVKDGGQIIVQP